MNNTQQNKLIGGGLVAGTGLLGAGLGAASARPILDRTIGPGYTDLDFEIKNSAYHPSMHKNNANRSPLLLAATGTGGGLGLVAGSLATKKLGMFSYMDAKYGDSKKPRDWTKKTKYNRKFKDKGISL
jgi:hypothetical protein